MPNEPRYTIDELADLAGVSVRTVRYYVSQGLLSVDVTPGPGPKYDDNHLARLRLIRRLQAEHLPLAEIRQRLSGVSDAALDVFFGTPAAPRDSALDYIKRLSESPTPYTPAPPPSITARPRLAIEVPATPDQEPPEHRVERSQWERIELAPDIELHIRRPLSRASAKRVDRLIPIARDLLREDQP